MYQLFKAILKFYMSQNDQAPTTYEYVFIYRVYEMSFWKKKEDLFVTSGKASKYIPWLLTYFIQQPFRDSNIPGRRILEGP